MKGPRGGVALLYVTLFLSASSAGATTIFVMTLAAGRADIVIDGSIVRQLREGQTSPEGVKLLRSDGRQAVFEFEGRTEALGIGETNAPSVALQADERGHFIATVYVNGVSAKAVVDTGATFVSINRAEAERFGVMLQRAQRGFASTANGVIQVWRVTLSTVQLGGIVLKDVEAAVTEGGAEQSPFVLLGNSFLRELELRRVGSTLTLTRRY